MNNDVTSKENEAAEIDKKLIEGHEYDGIKELDNPLPDWWLFIFYATIIFSAIYYFHYDLGGGGLSTDQELASSLQARQVQQKKAAASAPVRSEEEVLAFINDPTAMAEAMKIYVTNCQACHAAGGAGLIGPNLTDRFWIHGEGKVGDIMKMIKEGVPAKGMPPWQGLIKNDDIEKLTAYIVSLRDSQPAGAKKPEGTEYR